MTIIPKIRCKLGENLGVELFINLPQLDGEFTFLNTDYTAGVSSFSVENGNKFTAGDYFVIGNIQSQKTEILNVTTPSASAITLTSPSLYTHIRGEKVQFIPYNQVEIYKNGAFVTALSIRVDSLETYYNDVNGLATDTYKIRFKNSTTTKYSSYSDDIVGSGYVENSAGSIIRKALVALGEEIDGEVITKEFLYEALNELRRDIDEDVNIIRWPFRTAFGYDAGDIIPGQYKLTLPTNLRYPSTNENVLSVRLGKSSYPLKYLDKQGINNYYKGVAHAKLGGDITIASTSIILDSSGDFDESGDIDIASPDISTGIDTVSYTANTESTKTLSGVTGIAVSHLTGVDVWQGVSAGLPMFYTVDNGEMIFNCSFGDDYAGENIWLDYYKTITDINSDGDLLDEPFYSIYIDGLKWKIKAKKDTSLVMTQDADFIQWNSKRKAQVDKNFTGQNLRIDIDLPN